MRTYRGKNPVTILADMRFAFSKIVVVLVLAFTAADANAGLRLGSPFTDHMVLQREIPIVVWGWENAEATVTISFAGQQKTTNVGDDGKWQIKLDPLNASFKPSTMKVVSSETQNALLFSDILVGEVWICSGQSNMQMSVKQVKDVAALVDHSENIRCFNVPRTVAFTEQATCQGEWSVDPPDSAVAFAFAHSLQQAADVPIGIILTCWGSSSLEAWMPRDMTETVPHFKTMMDAFDANRDAQDKIKSILNGPRPWGTQNDIFLRRQSNILYNAMIAPLAPYTCRGLVWYQGERNTQSMHGMIKEPWFSQNSGMLMYGDALKQWVLRYRKQWNRNDMHFLVAMLPGFGNVLDTGSQKGSNHPAAHSWAWMRESQLKVKQLPRTGVANTIDLGHLKNIHPKDKLPVGKRLALLAARDALGMDVEADGPMMKRVEVAGDHLIVHFDHADGLTTHDGQPPKAFWLADESLEWYPAQATLANQAIVLRCDEINKPLYVRYAFAGKPDVNLVNSSKLPAYPFRSDSFAP